MPKRRREDCSPPTTPSSPSLAPGTSSPAFADEPAHSSKYIQTSKEAPTRAVMKCSLPPHELIEFSTFEEFEAHYASIHAHRCSECRKNFPSEHFLQLHISENHDPLSEAKRAKGEKTFYDFAIVNTGIDKRSSMLRPKHRRQSSAASRAFHREQRSSGTEKNLGQDSINPEASKPSIPIPEVMDNAASIQGSSADADVDDLTSTMSALKFIPPSVRFGRGGRRGGLSSS